jgi:anti-sigma regulatory factor (Ser/Thr protein kinase)
MMFWHAGVVVSETSQIGEARREANRLAAQVGLDEGDRGRVAIIVTELATNLARYAQGGEILLRPFVQGDDSGIEVLAIDRGPGMANVQRCLEDGYSSGGTPGNGLGAVRRLASEFDIFSAPPGGTVVLTRVRAAGRPAPSAGVPVFEWGVVSRPVPPEVVCGDTWRILIRENQLSLMVADGLGHGPEAAVAADRAASLFQKDGFSPAADLLTSAHQALVGSRGAAVAVAQIDLNARKLRYAGVGNIAASLRSPPGAKGKGLVSHNGTIGVAMRKVQNFEYDCPPGALLILHSDGLQTRWDLESYSGLAHRHAGVVAGVLYRDFCRGRDDVTICVVRCLNKAAG